MKTDAPAVAQRIYILMASLAAGGIAGSFVMWGREAALGFAVGCAISFANAWWMRRVAMAIGQDGKKPLGAAVVAVFRYLGMGAVLYGILNYSESGFLAALAGCFVHIIAVVLEVVFELTYGTP